MGLFFDDRRDLFDWMMFALPFRLTLIIMADFTSAPSRFPRTLPNGLFHFGLGCAPFQRLLFGMLGKTNAFHDSPLKAR